MVPKLVANGYNIFALNGQSNNSSGLRTGSDLGIHPLGTFSSTLAPFSSLCGSGCVGLLHIFRTKMHLGSVIFIQIRPFFHEKIEETGAHPTIPGSTRKTQNCRNDGGFLLITAFPPNSPCDNFPYVNWPIVKTQYMRISMSQWELA